MPDLQTILVETILNYVFWLRREDRQIMPITEQLLYQTEKRSHRSCSIKKAFRIRKHFCNFHKKTSVLKSLLNKVAGHRPANLLKRDFNTDVFL